MREGDLMRNPTAYSDRPHIVQNELSGIAIDEITRV